MQDLNEIYLFLGRIESKVDILMDSDHEKRIGSLERWRAWVAGAAFVAVALAGYAVKMIV